MQFFPNDSLVYDVFGLFQCILSKTGNLLLFHLTAKSQGVHFYMDRETIKVVAYSSSLQKLLKVVSGYTKIDTDTNEYLDFVNL